MLHYEISGNAPQDLVLLHGFMENNTIWSDMESQLSEKFRLIKIDLPGHGKSETLSSIHTMELMAEEVKKVTDSLGITQINLLGHSMGGYVSLAFAKKYRTDMKSLSLFFSTPLPDSESKKEIRRKSITLIEENFSSFVNASIPNLFDSDKKEDLKDKIKRAKEIAVSTPVKGVTAAVRGMMDRPNRTDILEKFEGKTLIILGEKDNAVSTQDVLKIIPEKENIKVHVLNCGHNGHWEKPNECAEIITKEL
ncbi:MAG: alpha/beta fold hydrolase [Cloacibacterium sp.]|jgi:pimeloyl-ACP methyl ester carboxylesterase|nr:alpha/beta fold hydrolase [Cloacibacterium sp.]